MGDELNAIIEELNELESSLYLLGLCVEDFSLTEMKDEIHTRTGELSRVINRLELNP